MYIRPCTVLEDTGYNGKLYITHCYEPKAVEKEKQKNPTLSLQEEFSQESWYGSPIFLVLLLIVQKGKAQKGQIAHFSH